MKSIAMTSNVKTIQLNTAACFVVALIFLLVISVPASALTRIKDIARPKGQRVNKLVGHGIVIGLKGTGDGDALMTKRAYAAHLDKLGNPSDVSDIGNPKNIAYVAIEVVLGENGQNEGDVLNVSVSSLHSAKSLEGGTLLISTLQGPNFNDQTLYGSASGSLVLVDADIPTKAIIYNGAVLEQDVEYGFIDEKADGTSEFSLVVHDHLAEWDVARLIKTVIEEEFEFPGSGDQDDFELIARKNISKVVGPKLIVISLNEKQTQNYAQFISRILNFTVELPEPIATVVINNKDKTIVFNSAVEISPCVVTIEGMKIRILKPEPIVNADNPSIEMQSWVKMNSLDEDEALSENLDVLLNLLNQLSVDFDGQVKTIKAIDTAKCLRANLVFEN